MTGNPDVIKALQFALTSEAHLNLQCRLDARSLKFMGVKKVARRIYDLGDSAHCYMKYVTDRLLFLGGDAGYQIAKVSEQATLSALLENQLALENAIIQPFEEAVQTCMKALDDASRNLFEHLLKWQEKDMLWISRQLELIKGMGEQEYIAEKL